MYPTDTTEQAEQIPDVETPVEDTQEQPQLETVTPDEIKAAFEDLLRNAETDDRVIRDNNLLIWKKLEYYFNNILDAYMDPITRDWRIPDWEEYFEDEELPPRFINIFRPHCEAVIAALSVNPPSIFFHPQDADDADDIETAKTMSRIVDLLAVHNEHPLLFMKAIKIALIGGTIFAYNYYHESPKFGTFRKPKVELKNILFYEAYCPNCGAGLDADVGQGPQGNMYQCPICGYQGPGQIKSGSESIPQIVGFDNTLKGSIAQELFSGTNVKVSAYVTKQEECGYLLLGFMQSAAMLRNVFPEYADKINPRQYPTREDPKVPPHYFGQVPDSACNVQCLWLRPWQFWDLGTGKPELIKKLQAEYPDGCYAIFIDREFIDAYPENFDEHWTISYDPMSSSIYTRPLAENLAVIQEIRANLVEIELQTAEFGIPETFADVGVLDFEKYGEGRAKPGLMTPVKPRAGKGIPDAFYTTKTAILSQEIEPLRQHIDQDGQFVLGSFPSVYGGPNVTGSQTASEYTQSRAMALQRLGNVWKLLCHFWAKFQSRSAVEYASMIKDLNLDENFSKRIGVDQYTNVWIHSASLSGNVGRCEPESSEQLPISWAQKKDAIMQLLQAGIPEIISVLTHPQNATIMKQAVGLPEMFIPGEEDRLRQFKEFQLLSKGFPVPTNPYDDDKAHIEILQYILEGELSDGLTPQAKQAVMMHFQEHQMKLQSQMMPPAGPAPVKAVNGGQGENNA